MMSLLVTPPSPQDASYKEFQEEQNQVKESMKRKAIKTQSFLNSLDGVSCTDIDGAMYAFPRLELPKWFEDLASERGVQSDFLYDSLSLSHHAHKTHSERIFKQRQVLPRTA